VLLLAGAIPCGSRRAKGAPAVVVVVAGAVVPVAVCRGRGGGKRLGLATARRLPAGQTPNTKPQQDKKRLTRQQEKGQPPVIVPVVVQDKWSGNETRGGEARHSNCLPHLRQHGGPCSFWPFLPCYVRTDTKAHQPYTTKLKCVFKNQTKKKWYEKGSALAPLSILPSPPSLPAPQRSK